MMKNDDDKKSDYLINHPFLNSPVKKMDPIHSVLLPVHPNKQMVIYDKPMVKEDPTNPFHYKQYKGFEVIDITKQLDFLYGNAVKYILLAPYKSNEAEDIKKAIWYLNKKLEEINE